MKTFQLLYESAESHHLLAPNNDELRSFTVVNYIYKADSFTTRALSNFFLMKISATTATRGEHRVIFA